MYLSNMCSEGQSTNAIVLHPVENGEIAQHVFKSKRELHFSERELVGAGIGIALFMLSREDWIIARYMVVGTYDVIVSGEELKNCKGRMKRKEFYDDSLPF